MKKIILIITIFLLTGCYDYNELTDLGIISAMIVDYENGEYTINLEMLETSEDKSDPSYFLSGNGKTFELALSDAYNKSPKHIYLSHLSIIVLSTSLDNDNLLDVYNYFTANTKVNKETSFIMCQDIKELLDFKTEEKEPLGESIKNIIHYNKIENATYRTSEFSEILHNYLNNANYYLGTILVEDKSLVLKDTYIVNNKNKFKIPDEYILLANLLSKDTILFNIALDDAYQVYNTKVGTKVLKDKIVIELASDIRLLVPPEYDINDEEKIISVNKELKSYLKDRIEKSIRYAKELGIDLYNFDLMYSKYQPKSYYKGIWKNIDYEVKVSAKLNEKGIILNRMDDENEK